jgi:hypothetical protein
MSSNSRSRIFVTAPIVSALRVELALSFRVVASMRVTPPGS